MEREEVQSIADKYIFPLIDELQVKGFTGALTCFFRDDIKKLKYPRHHIINK